MVASDLFILKFAIILLNIVNIRATLFPINLVNEELYLPNDWNSVKDCPVRYYDHGRTGFAAPVRGIEAYEREFAHMAAIGWTDENGKIEWNCGGSLISEKYILTAGHCISWKGKEPDVARMGDLNLQNDTDDKYAQQLSIEEIIPHPLYSARYNYNDIALIKLKGSIKVHDTVCPACLWTNSTVRFQFLESCGYGQVGYLEEKTPKLLKVTLSPVDLDKCSEDYPPDRHLSEGLKDHQMCAADPNHAMDTCLGDSGGPLQIKLLGNGKMNPFIVGVTSFGKSCGTEIPGVYTRISPFIDWIESVTKIDTDPRRCAFKYSKYREFEPDVIQDKGPVMEWIDHTKFHVDTTPKNLNYIVNCGSCIGSLITEKFVLTTASCMNSLGKSFPKVKTKDGTEINVKSITLHPQFTSGSIDNDIALIELVSEVVFNEDVRPACIFSGSKIPQEFEFNLLGWGSKQNLQNKDDKNLTYNDNEQKALVSSRSKPINYTYCNQFYETDGIKVDAETKVCYGNTDYYLVPDTCQLAPGAPIERESFASDRFYSYIIGLAAVANDCGFGFPGIAARISYYIDWIDSVIFSGKVSNRCFLNGTLFTCKRVSECPQLVQDIEAGNKKLIDHICKFDVSINPLVYCPKSNSDISKIESCPKLYNQYKRTNIKPYDDTFGDEFAHLALIGYGQTRDWHCRGNLISDKHVLTSNECVKRDSKYDTVALGNINSILYGIAKIVTNERTLTLLTLDNVVSFSKDIFPICLWTDETKIPFHKSYIVSPINSPLVSAETRPYQTATCKTMKIASSIKSDDQSCVKFVKKPLCTSPGTGIHFIRNETGLLTRYLIGLLDDVGLRNCDPTDKDAEYAFTRIGSNIDWIVENMV